MQDRNKGERVPLCIAQCQRQQEKKRLAVSDTVQREPGEDFRRRGVLTRFYDI